MVSPFVRFMFMIEVGFVVLSSVGAHLRAKRMAPADDRTTKPDHQVVASMVNLSPSTGFVVPIPEGLRGSRRLARTLDTPHTFFVVSTCAT